MCVSAQSQAILLAKVISRLTDTRLLIREGNTPSPNRYRHGGSHMKNHILIASAITAFAIPVFAQIAPVTPMKDSSQIRDENHDFRPDRVDQRSDDKNLNSNEARDVRQKKIKKMKEQSKDDKARRDDLSQPRSDTREAY
jgi:hypothetical protein